MSPFFIRALILLLAVPFRVQAKEIHLAIDGDDSALGTAEFPVAGFTRAEELAGPGDTVWIHGGRYEIAEKSISRVHRGQAHVIHLTKSGTPQAPIHYRAVPGEVPVFDFSAVKPRGLRVTAFYVDASHLHLEGFEVVGVQVTITGHTQSIGFDNQGSHNRYERLAVHDGKAIGFWIGSGRNNLILNCDAYRNHDDVSEDKLGGNVDGFGYHGKAGTTGNRFVGCRAWLNSDDGFDFISAQEAGEIENCWAFRNGWSADSRRLADGNGFKLGGFGAMAGGRLPDPVPRHRIRGSLAVSNASNGFYANHHPGGNDWIENCARNNSRANFNMLGRDPENLRSEPGGNHLLVGNLAFGGKLALTNLDAETSELRENQFSPPMRFREEDFISLDEAGLAAPRQADGSLPEVGFLIPREPLATPLTPAQEKISH